MAGRSYECVVCGARDNRYGKLRLCSKHYQQRQAAERQARPIGCTRCGRPMSRYGARGLCGRCYNSWKKYRDAERIDANLAAREPGRRSYRYAAERMLGRKLRRGEHVHHIDLNSRNNVDEDFYIFKSNRDHQLAHVSLERVAGELVRRGVIRFEGGRYLID